MIPLERLLENSVVSRNFDKLAALTMDTGGQSVGIRLGVQTVTFAGSAFSPNYTINHGLGKTPKIVIPGNQFISGTVSVTPFSANFTGTTFLLYGHADIAWTGSIFIPWMVIG